MGKKNKLRKNLLKVRDFIFDSLTNMKTEYYGQSDITEIVEKSIDGVKIGNLEQMPNLSEIPPTMDVLHERTYTDFSMGQIDMDDDKTTKTYVITVKKKKAKSVFTSHHFLSHLMRFSSLPRVLSLNIKDEWDKLIDEGHDNSMSHVLMIPNIL